MVSNHQGLKGIYDMKIFEIYKRFILYDYKEYGFFHGWP